MVQLRMSSHAETASSSANKKGSIFDDAVVVARHGSNTPQRASVPPCSLLGLFQSGDPMPLTRGVILNEGIADGYRPSLYLDVCYDPVKGEKVVAVADLSGTQFSPCRRSTCRTTTTMMMMMIKTRNKELIGKKFMICFWSLNNVFKAVF
jgi:hypothetical protein